MEQNFNKACRGYFFLRNEYIQGSAHEIRKLTY